ncbi:MAG: pyrroline-5-carboxylate reductase [Elusimicrobium sp.]|jgi:pyrroline-5-carboxylate reductase|nr:pyrroline-5-carboxylate reductase [Elusimicrobium sp.]
MKNIKILFAGCGEMGGALIDAWAGIIPPQNFFIVKKRADGVSALRARGFNADTKFPQNFNADIVVIAVKPKTVKEILPHVAPHAKNGALLFSVAAGRTVKFIEDNLGFPAAVARCMPNLGVAVKQGASGMFANERVTAEQMNLCTTLMSKCGVNVWLEREELINAVIAVSGSSPAYIAYFSECLTKACADMGLKENDARALALQALRGTAEFLQKTGEPPQNFIKKVATPGGSTEAAMNVLTSGDFSRQIAQSCQAAALAAQKREEEN